MAITPALLPTLTSPIAFFVPPTLTLVSELTVYEAVNPSSLFRVIDVGDTAVTCPRWTSITTGLPSWPLSVSSPCSTRFASARRGQPCRCAGLSSDPFGPEVASDPFGSKIASNPLGLVVADEVRSDTADATPNPAAVPAPRKPPTASATPAFVRKLVMPSSLRQPRRRGVVAVFGLCKSLFANARGRGSGGGGGTSAVRIFAPPPSVFEELTGRPGGGRLSTCRWVGGCVLSYCRAYRLAGAVVPRPRGAPARRVALPAGLVLDRWVGWESAGINRHEGGDGRALRRRASDPRRPRGMRRRPVRAWRSVDRGTCRPGY